MEEVNVYRIKQAIKELSEYKEKNGGSRENSLVFTKLQEALFWHAEDLRIRQEKSVVD